MSARFRSVVSRWLSPQRAGLALALLAAAVLLAAWGFQYGGGLRPCPLCLYQRWPWWAALILGALAAGPVRPRPRIGAALLALAALGLAGGAGLAAYHAGIEWGFFPAPGGCAAGNIDFDADSEALAEAIMNRPPTRCDAAAWRFLGLSLAGYNFLLSGLGSAWALFGARASWGRAVRKSLSK